jgi:hypothetical protein
MLLYAGFRYDKDPTNLIRIFIRHLSDSKRLTTIS